MSPERDPSGRWSRDSVKPARSIPVAVGLRSALRDGYSWRNLRADVMAGIVVGIVALPLSMALAIASGVPPQYGLYAAIVAGCVTALAGGSRLNITGPTAAFVVLLAPVASQYGVGGLAVASLMAGGLLVFLGVARLGRLIQFVPSPVTTGFTAGIAVVIATLQVKDFLGLDVSGNGSHVWERLRNLWSALPSLHWQDLLVGATTLALLVAWPRVTKKIPGPLVAILLGALLAAGLNVWFDGGVATIGTRFSYVLGGETHAGIPQLPPIPLLPWGLPSPDGQPLGLSWHLITDLAGPAMAIAGLGAIESLLAAVVADGMAGTRHDPDAELIGQGLGNLIAPFFGGFAATGAIARTATSIRSGGRSPIAAVVHSVFVLVAVLALAPALSYLPMASMAALLLLVAWNMSELRHFMHMLRVAPRSDVAVLLSCFGLTVLFDMVLAVGVGVVMAALLFMRRMAEISGSQLVGEGTGARSELPSGVMLYEIAGPLFFGAAEKAVGGISASGGTDVLILDMHAVPAMDVTGLIALESLLKKMQSTGTQVHIVGLQVQPRGVFAKAGIAEGSSLHFFKDISTAVEAVKLKSNL